MLTMHLQPIQNKLYQRYEYGKSTVYGFGGPRGGTKSHSSDVLMLLRRYKYPGTNGLFIMRVYQDMMDIHIRPMFDAYPHLEKHFNKQDMILKLPKGSYIRFLSGDNLETFQKRKGRGFADVIVDQSELFSQDEIEFFYTINRSAKPGITPKTLLCFNPGNVGHAYHKRIFYDKIYENKEKPEQFEYIEAKGWDNAYWCLQELADNDKIDPKDLDEMGVLRLIAKFHSLPEEKRFEMYLRSNYGRTLDALPEHKRRAELLGDMEIFEGMFWEDFRYKHHVIKNYKFSDLRKTIGGLDYGNTTVLIISQRDAEGKIVAAGECHLENYTNPTERANAIADYLLEREIYKLEIIYDTDMEISQLSNVGFDKTPISIFKEVFRQRMKENAPRMRVVNKKSLDKNVPYRIVVNDSVKDYLHIRKICNNCNKEIGRRETICNCGIGTIRYESNLYFAEECKHLIKFMSEAIYDPDDKTGRDFERSSQATKTDHPYDGFKYGFMELQVPKKKKEDPRPSWLIELQKEAKMKTENDFYAK